MAILDPVRLDLVIRLREGNDLETLRPFALKLAGEIVRIALVLEAMQDPAAEVITAETMRAACEWAPFLIAHFRAVLGDGAERDEVKLARRLLDHLKRHRLTEISARDALHHLDGNGLSMEELTPDLNSCSTANGCACSRRPHRKAPDARQAPAMPSTLPPSQASPSASSVPFVP